MSFLTPTGEKAGQQASAGGLSQQNEVLLAKAVEAGEKARITLEQGGWVTPRQKSRLNAAIRNAEEAEKIFVLANVGLVKSIVRKQSRTQTRFITYEDMEQTGYEGLLKALRNFDWRRGFRFSTYAHFYIRKEIGVARAAAAVIRVPMTRHLEIKRVKQLYNDMTQTLDREPSFMEMAERTGLTVGRIEEDFALVNRVVYSYPKEDMERLSSGNDAKEVGWPKALLPFDALMERVTIEELNMKLDVLDSKERTALEMRFGLGERREHSYREIEEALNLSHNTGSRFTRKALKKIKKQLWAAGQSW
jgi:RNA polymerase primary sigma factor